MAPNLPLLGLIGLSLAGFGQHRGVFIYDQTEIASNLVYSPGIKINFKKPQSGSTTMVSINGNFAGTFTVNGIGTASSSRSDNFINILTNQPLTFQAENFTILYDGGTAANTAGSVSYEMQLYDGTASSVGAAITGPVDGTDNMFNGATLTLSSAAIPSNNEVVLRLSRALNLTQLAEGAVTYTATGNIVLTIN